MRISKIAGIAEYWMDEQFQNSKKLKKKIL